MDNQTEFLNAEQTSILLKVRPSTLQRWRSEKRGPAYSKVGKQILYKRQDIDEFFEKSREVTK